MASRGSAHERPSRRRRQHDDTPDTTQAFDELARLPDGERRRELRDELVRAWLPMADRLARHYEGRGESLEDLRQVAALGLLKAVDRYDPAAGTPFPAYAVPTVRGEIKRHFRDEMWAVHVPRRVQELRAAVYRARETLAAAPDRPSVTVGRLVELTGLSEDEVLLGLEAQDAFTALSLERPLTKEGDGGPTLADILGDDDDALARVEEREAAAPALRSLPERERTILYMRFFLQMSQRDIAAQMGISQMHVSRLLRRSCTTVRSRAA